MQREEKRGKMRGVKTERDGVRRGKQVWKTRMPTLGVGFWEVLTRDEMHDAGLASREAQRSQRDVPVQEPTLVDQS